MQPILNIAFYRFLELSDLSELKSRLKSEGQRLGLKGTILLAFEGVNGMLAGPEASVREFQSLLTSIFGSLDYKEGGSETVPFGRLFIKIKKEIIPIGCPEVRPSRSSAPRIRPEELKKWLDEKRPVVLLDTRNEYEIEHGTFKRATRMGLKHFREFPGKLEELPEDVRSGPVVMFCTGGIRCEKAGAVAMKAGMKDVYQLDGGILRYFEVCGDAHYEGKCFVFDERVAISPPSRAHD